ncbi:kinase-like protein [Lophium mytilinum]|uniref:non-specific serine/threonine protein kinase n=1 Tax=Lophium mytilinum TaxID=390894 RepID=A0A6A6R368_9PEZI|nr:kinase-like protein [Lophium mytilinum]
MPRRRPPGDSLGLKPALLHILLLLPWLTTAAQQQQPPHRQYRRSPREDALADTVTPPSPSLLDDHQLPVSRKRTRADVLVPQIERAIATLSSAPASSNAAVRAPPAGSLASPSGGITRHSARSLQDWEVEDFVLLATVDGHIHARDRNTGKELWHLDAGRPMVETIYHQKNDSADENAHDIPFMWVVEPSENGRLYYLEPGPQPSLKDLHLTIRELEGSSPYYSDNPPVVYNAEKKTVMYQLDARTGKVLKSFGLGGDADVNAESCAPQVTGFADSHLRECKGNLNLGRTEYTIRIENMATTEPICTIKYFEWTPNNRDRDLHGQYLTTMDNKYIYSRFDGEIYALDHSSRRQIDDEKRVYRKKLASPVVRVFDVARPFENYDDDPPLILLPQPIGPGSLDDASQNVWLNCTESGSWYAMSEDKYPAVTDGAAKALCYTPQWNRYETWGGAYVLPEKKGLVGVHSLEYAGTGRGDVPTISAPLQELKLSIDEPISPEVPPDGLRNEIEERKKTALWPWLITILALILGLGSYSFAKPETLDVFKRSIALNEKPLLVPSSIDTDPVTVPEAHSADPDERRVRFAIPEEEPDVEPLSRTTTVESSLAIDGERMTPEVPGQGDINENGTETVGETTNGQDVAKPKKKAHRGSRGGKKKRKAPKEEDEIGRIVEAAKQLDQDHPLQPDEITINGGNVQDISNIKKIGKLTIDFDKVLGNGSGGTFVFGGKWNERDVAVKRMLPQYFGLAEQEVKLLQESDLHPNVIRYFDDEKDEHFLYIAVELCQASLWELYRDGRPGDDRSPEQIALFNELNSDAPRALYQLALGLNHLHSLRIIHRDVKPQNILIAYPQRNQKSGPRLVISDFGLCKTLPDNVSTLVGTTGNAGTVGWKAPELILQPKELEARQNSNNGHSRDSSSSTDPVSQGVKRAVDIFSLGCVFFYVLSQGSHPFDDDEGWMQIRELNIKKNKANFSRLENLGHESEEAIRLIEWMLENKPEDRPTALQVMQHPFFWSAEKRLNFLCDCSDHWEREPRDPPSAQLLTLEAFIPEVLDKKRDFLGKLDRAFIASLGKQRKYTGDRMLDLLRALRNKKNHYEDMDETVKAKVGPLPAGYLEYWTSRFPKLLMACHYAVTQCGLQNEPRFRPYFEGSGGL